MPNSNAGRGIFRVLSKILDFAKIVISSRGTFRRESNIQDEGFWEKDFQPFTIIQKAPSLIIDSVLITPLKLLTIFAKASTLMFDWVLEAPLTCSKKYKKYEKPVKELFLKMLQLRQRNNLQEIAEKNYWKMIFFTVIFSKFCKGFRSRHQRCSIKKNCS